jgi:hypothetical protein
MSMLVFLVFSLEYGFRLIAQGRFWPEQMVSVSSVCCVR